MLRKTYGPIKDPNAWRIRANNKLQEMCIKPNIVTTTKVRGLEWAGVLVRMSDHRTIQKVFQEKPDTRAKAGRPKLRWLDCTENDMKSVGVKKWRKKAEGIFVWAVIPKETLVEL